MHILFLSDNFPPESNAPANRTYEHAREWVQAGHRVTVITCAPNFPMGKVFKGYRNRLWQSEEMAGIRVIRVWSYIARNEGFARRILDYLSYMVTAFLAALPVRGVDVVVGTSPQFFTVCAAWAAAGLKRKPFVFELRDIWPESIRAVSAMQESRILDWLEKLELFLYRRAAMVICVTHSFKENLIARGVPEAKLRVVTNGADMGSFKPRLKDIDLIERLSLQDKFVAGYIGTLGMAHGLNTLLDAAQLMAARPETADARLIIIGDGAERDTLDARIQDEGIDNVLLLDRVSREEVVRFWSILDIAIIHLKRSDLFKCVIPSKLFECMAMQVPVLHGVEGESADIVKKYRIGLTVEPENPRKMANEIGALMKAPERLRSMALSGRAAAEDFNRGVQAKKMLSYLQEVSAP
jgi:glycosyltransferase involved in cell wall biosynthesis